LIDELGETIPKGKYLWRLWRSGCRTHFLITVRTLVVNRANIWTEFYESHGELMTFRARLNKEVLLESVAEGPGFFFDLLEEILPPLLAIAYEENPSSKRYGQYGQPQYCFHWNLILLLPQNYAGAS